jgi:hypothetical protein
MAARTSGASLCRKTRRISGTAGSPKAISISAAFCRSSGSPESATPASFSAEGFEGVDSHRHP